MKLRINPRLTVLLTLAALTIGLFPFNHQKVLAQNSDLVTFPSPEVAFIVGPQVKSGTSTVKGAQWFDQNAFDRGLQFGAAFPASPPQKQLTGTIALTQGSTSVAGTGTKFTTELTAPVNQWNFFIRDQSGLLQVHYLASVVDDTHLSLSQAWQQPTQADRAYYAVTATDYNPYVEGLNYYDQVLAQYIEWLRTGDTRFRDNARKIADTWWQSPFIDEGRTPFTNQIAPRQVSLNGLILRALDGRPEMWPWITNTVRGMYALWISDLTGNTTSDRATYPNLYYGAREPGYVLLYTANLGKVHPDPAIRAEMTAKALHGAVDYIVRVQKTDGSWRWGDNAWIGDATQPFHVGVLLEALIAVHQLTGNEAVKQSIIKGTTALYLQGYNPNGWRAFYYQVGGSWKDGTDCSKGCGGAANPWPASPLPDGTTVAEQVSASRQLNNTVVHVFGYAYVLTGDTKFLQWGDDIFDATYSGEDGFRSLAWFREKEYDESYRSGGKYLAWRLGGSFPAPSPTPVPSPTVTPTPLPTPTPTPTSCNILAPDSVTIPRRGSQSVSITLSNIIAPVTIDTIANSGQVTVSPRSKTVSGTSAIVPFLFAVKQNSSSVTFKLSCESPKTTQVIVR